MKTKKVSVYFLLFWIGIKLASSINAFAHPAKSLTATFNNETHILTVHAVHRVKDPADHFIDKIIVKLNGQEVITQTLMSQDSKNDMKVQYKIIDAKPGDRIIVITHCNKMGTKRVKIWVPKKR